MCCLKFDLHVHSCYSHDSFTPIDKILKFAEKIGLNGIAITDHNTIKGGLAAKKLKGFDLKIITGSEITLDNGGEILGLFLNEEVKPTSFFEANDQIKQQGGIVVLPHPFRASKFNISKFSKKELSNIKFIEGINAFNYKSENEEAIKFAKNNSLITIAGSDAHHFSVIGKAYTIINKETENIKKELIQGNINIQGESLNKNERARVFINRELKARNYRKLMNYYFKRLTGRYQ